MDAAAALRQLLEIGQPSFVHPALDQARVHPVEAEDDQFLLELLGGPARLTRGRSGRADDKQSEKYMFHKMLEERARNYNICSMRVLGVDVGARRIGLAISDRSRTLARPLTTLTIASAADGIERV